MPWEPKGAHPMPPPQEILYKGLYIYIYLRGGGGIGFLSSSSGRTNSPCSQLAERTGPRQRGWADGGDDRVISLFRETNLLSTGKRFKAKKNHRKIQRTLFCLWILDTFEFKSLRPNTLLLINHNYMRWFYECCITFDQFVFPIVFKYVFSVFLSPCFLFVFVFILLLLVSFLNSLPWWRSAWFHTCQCHSKIFQILLSIDTLMLSTVRECMSWIVMLTSWYCWCFRNSSNHLRW